MTALALIGSLGWTEILLLLLIVVFLFGAKRIPEIARGLGQGIRGFRSSLRGEDEPSSPPGDEDASKNPPP